MSPTEGYCPYNPDRCLPVVENRERGSFLAHGHSAEASEDLRPLVAAALERAGYATRPADQITFGRPQLCNSCVQVRSAQLAVFDLPRAGGNPLDEARLWIELGLAVGHSVPLGLLAHHDAPLPDLLDGADLLRYGTYGELERHLPDLVTAPTAAREGCPLCGGSHHKRKFWQRSSSCLLLPSTGLNPDVADRVASALERTKLHLAKAGTPGQAPLPICRLADLMVGQRLVLIHLEPPNWSEALIGLGLASGLEIPWLFMARQGVTVPTCLQGLEMVRYAAYRQLEERLVGGIPGFLERRKGRSRQERRAAEVQREEWVREAVKWTLDRLVAEQAPQEQETFEELVWQLMNEGAWPDEKRGDREIRSMAFTDAEGSSADLPAISPAATLLLMAAVEPGLRQGWLSTGEVTERIGALADRWQIPANVREPLLEYTSAYLPAALQRAEKPLMM
jgi:hypothetical protein